MARRTQHPAEPNLNKILGNYLFRELEVAWLKTHLNFENLKEVTLYASQPIYTAFRRGESLDVLYVITSGGPVIVRSTPLDRIIGVSYPGTCFGMRSLAFSHGLVSRTFPSLVEAYKTTSILKLPLAAVQAMYQESKVFRHRYDLLFELQEKFQYHLLNCSTYPPQAVAALLRALIYQERELGNQPNPQGIYAFDLPVDIIAHASQLNQRTVEQVLKGMHKVGLLAPPQANEAAGDIVSVLDPEAMKETYSATRGKVDWWPLRDKS